MSLQSIQIERHALSGLLQNQDVIPEIEGFMSEKDFVAQPHATIYSVLISSYLKNEKIDKVILAQKIKNLGISWKDDIDIFSYLESITFTPLTKQATLQACQELVKLRCLRDVSHVCEEIKDHVEKSVNQPLDQTISEADAIYGAKINSFSCEDKVVDLYDGLLDLAEERGNNPQTEVGFATQFPEFNRLYGGLRRKNLYIIASRAKAGKSSFLNELASEMSAIHSMRVLYLDSEMSTEETRFRSMAAKTGVPLWYIESGNFRKNPEMLQKIRTGLKDVNKKYKVDHYFIGNKKNEEIGAICRRWYLKNVGRGGKCMFVFDYFKAIDKLSHNQQEYQAMGDKVDYFKKLGEELDAPTVAAVQNNRAGITNGREVSEIVDDESSVGISDRITWYASGVWILRRRVAEEIVLDTPESGSHKLINLVSRFEGRDAAGHQNMLLRTFPDGKRKYINNFINIDITNFKVEERGSARDAIARQNAQFLVADPKNPTVEEETL
jgi:replicative DNA helicase